MRKSNQGYIALHRKAFQNKFYFSEPFCRFMAWIDLLMLANHEPGTFYHRNIRIDVLRGQTAYSVESLSVRWKWSRGKVERWLRTLENERQIVRQKNNITTIISISNYDEYQINGKARSKTGSKPDGLQTDTNNNNKRIINKGGGQNAPPLRRISI